MRKMLADRKWKGVVLRQLDTPGLLKTLEDALKISDTWNLSKVSEDVVIHSGYLPYSSVKAYRSTVKIAAAPEQVAEIIADKAIEFLPLWNQEFRDGRVLKILENGKNRKSWIHKVRYRTPPPLKDREYLYYMVKETMDNGSIMIGYVSISDDEIKPERGALRGLLYPTVHLCESPDGENTILKHILANNLGGIFSPFLQNTVLTRIFNDASIRDSVNQRNLFNELRYSGMEKE